MLERMRPVRLAGFLGISGLVAAAALGDEGDVLLALVAFLPVLFCLTLAEPGPRADHAQPRRDRARRLLDRPRARPRGAAARPRPRRRARVHGAARHVRRRHRRLPRRPRVRHPPARAADLAEQDLGGARDRHRSSASASVWYASRTYDGNWITGTEGLLLGVAVAFAAPLGDLFESLIKRDVGTKDTGGLFGVHGGALDRLDAALFSLIAGYQVWLATLS